MKYDEKVSEYMLIVASNLILSVASKNPDKMYDVLVDIKETINSYVTAAENSGTQDAG
jgi:hypothetical protein